MFPSPETSVQQFFNRIEGSITSKSDYSSFMVIAMGFFKGRQDVNNVCSAVKDAMAQREFEFFGKKVSISFQDLSTFDPYRYQEEIFDLMQLSHKAKAIDPRSLEGLKESKKIMVAATQFSMIKQRVLRELSNEVGEGQRNKGN